MLGKGIATDMLLIIPPPHPKKKDTWYSALRMLASLKKQDILRNDNVAVLSTTLGLSTNLSQSFLFHFQLAVVAVFHASFFPPCGSTPSKTLGDKIIHLFLWLV